MLNRVSVLDLPDLNKLRDGDPVEWNKAFTWLFPTAKAVAKVKLIRYPNDVEDIAMEALKKLLPHVLKVKRVEELQKILAKITHDESVDFLRKQSAQKRGEGNVVSLDEMVVDLIENHNQSVKVHAGDFDTIWHCVAEKLNPNERLVFNEIHLNGLRYEEIAQKHNIPIGSVGAHLSRAYKKLRECMGGELSDYL